MGVMLDPARNPHPTEEEIARGFNLVPVRLVNAQKLVGFYDSGVGPLGPGGGNSFLGC